jgi:hypothetical protein
MADEAESVARATLATYGKTFLIPRADLTFEEYADLWATVTQTYKSAHWWLGDCQVGMFARWGEQASQLLDPRTPETIRNTRWVCESIEPVRRHPELSFTHHRIVSSLVPDIQDELLARAERDDLTTRELTAVVQDMRPKPREVPAAPTAKERESGEDEDEAEDVPEHPDLGGTAATPAEQPAWPSNTAAAPPEDEDDLPEERGGEEGGDIGEPPAGEVMPLRTQAQFEEERRKLVEARGMTESIAKWLSGGSPDIDIATILEERALLWQAVEAAQDVLLGFPMGKVALRAAIAKLEQMPSLAKKFRESA